MKLTKKQIKQNEIKEAKDHLISLFIDELKKGKKPTVYTSVKHVSSSGMMRHIDVFVIVDNEPININWYIEQLGLYKRGSDCYVKNSDSLRVSGCGMDMGFSVVYNLSSVLFKDIDFSTFKISGRNGDKYETTDARYLLNQRWL